MIRRYLLGALVAAMIASAMPGHATARPTMIDGYRAKIARDARAAGIDPAAFFSAPATLSVYGSDGSVTRTTRPFGEIIEEFEPHFPASAATAEGPAGTPEIVAGNISHAFLTAYLGSTSEAVCQEVSVKESQYVDVPLPLPIVPVTLAPLLATPVPGLLSPIIPSSSWILPAYLVGGRMMHIKASYTQGLHTVGTLIGSNASTASGAPSPAPAWLPMIHATRLIEDRSIDFVGNTLGFAHAEFRFDAFGYTLCGGLGLMAFSNGSAIFDNHKVLGIQVGLPDVP